MQLEHRIGHGRMEKMSPAFYWFMPARPGGFDEYEVRLFESLADEVTAGLAKFGLFEETGSGG